MTIVYCLRKNKNSFIINDISLDQYKNRLTEFYIKEELNDAMKEMCFFVNSGVKISDAFEMIVSPTLKP